MLPGAKNNKTQVNLLRGVLTIHKNSFKREKSTLNVMRIPPHRQAPPTNSELELPLVLYVLVSPERYTHLKENEHNAQKLELVLSGFHTPASFCQLK